MADSDEHRYVRGPTYARREVPRFEFKPSSTGYTGGGYARVRSTEYREHTSGDGTDDVFVSIHRLAAVAWHLPDGELGSDVSLALLDGVDVHHVQPETDDRGMPAANGAEWTVLVDHGRHSEITQSQMRAWGEDAKRAASDDEDGDSSEFCPQCNERGDQSVTVGDRTGLCLDCATALARQTGGTIEM